MRMSVSILLGRTAGGFSRTDMGVETGRGRWRPPTSTKTEESISRDSWEPTVCRCTDGNGAGGCLRRGGRREARARGPGAGHCRLQHDGTRHRRGAREQCRVGAVYGTASGGLTCGRSAAQRTQRGAAGDFNRDGWMDVAGLRLRVIASRSTRTASTLRLAAAMRLAPRHAVCRRRCQSRRDAQSRDCERSTGTSVFSSVMASSPALSETRGISPQAAAVGRWWRLTSIAMAARPGHRQPECSTASVLWNETAFERAGFSFKRLSLAHRSRTA